MSKIPYLSVAAVRRANELAELKDELAALKAERTELREALAMLIKEMEDSTYEHDGHRKSGYVFREVCTLKAWNLAGAVLKRTEAK